MKESDKHVQSITLLVSVICFFYAQSRPSPLHAPHSAEKFPKLPVYFVQRDYVIGL
jgi:hypothetical protein